ncbi:serine hydrolase domain-containing protein [Motilibacter deserti]|uniref:serine hydrolase domain-containing protein n=1 Tax=Motilibacter deserti TaxID=2714956 RepID=UPI002F2B7610
MTSRIGDTLPAVEAWPVTTAAVGVVARDGTLLGAHGPLDTEFRLASVTKLLTAYAVLVAVEEEAVSLDDPAGPPGATVRHLLAHASGVSPDSAAVVASAVGARRVYSNAGYELLAGAVEAATGMPFAAYLREGVLAPLGMTSTALPGSAARDGVSTLEDLLAFARELQAPQLLHPDTLAGATSVQFPGLAGVLPGYGRQDPNDWGLGPELRGTKAPHWMAAAASPRAFGHFGQSGTYLWVDPEAGAACVCLTDRAFGEWAAQAWQPFNDEVLDAVRG